MGNKSREQIFLQMVLCFQGFGLLLLLLCRRPADVCKNDCCSTFTNLLRSTSLAPFSFLRYRQEVNQTKLNTAGYSAAESDQWCPLVVGGGDTNNSTVINPCLRDVWMRPHLFETKQHLTNGSSHPSLPLPLSVIGQSSVRYSFCLLCLFRVEVVHLQRCF